MAHRQPSPARRGTGSRGVRTTRSTPRRPVRRSDVDLREASASSTSTAILKAGPAEEPPAGSRELARDEDWPTAGPLSRRLVMLLDPPPLIRAAHLLAGGLLEYASVEQTVLLQSDGSVDPAAGSTGHDRQVIRHHADLVGLPVAGAPS